MRATITIDDALFADAQEYSGLTKTSEIVRVALKALIEREAARRLSKMGGSDPGATAAPRRRFG